MKYPILFAIWCYQFFFPKKWREKCLYKESCSTHVFRITKERGAKAGLDVLKYRMKNCKPGYHVLKCETENFLEETIVVTCNNEIIPNKEIDSRILDQ